MSLPIVNRTFESVIAPWGPRLTSTVTRDSTVSKWGTSSGKVVTPGAANFEGVTSDGTNDHVTVAGSTQHTLSAYCNAPSGATLGLQVDEYTSGGAYLRSQSVAFTGTGAWERITTSWTTQATCARLTNFSIYTSGIQARTLHMDGWQLDQAATAQTYDGDDATPPQIVRPDADLATTGWTVTPLFSKVNDQSDATVISATCA